MTLVQQWKIPVHVTVMRPELHVYPLKLREELEKELKKNTDSKIVVYGRCFPEIDDVVKKHDAERIQGENCYEIVAGETFFQSLKEDPGTYFLLPQFCRKFEELTKELTLKEMKEIFFKNYRRCIFLDTGVHGGEDTDLDDTECKKVAEELGLQYQKVYVGTDVLEKRLKELLKDKLRM